MWRDNLKNGYGSFTFEDGTTYDGPFENDRMLNRNIQGAPNPNNTLTSKGETQVNAPADNTANSKAKNDPKSPDKGATAKAAAATTQPQGKLDAKTLNATLNTTAGNATGKFGVKGGASKREVEQNPFKTLLDISDLIENEGPSATGGPKEIEKEV
jgi:hypothetical protein